MTALKEIVETLQTRKGEFEFNYKAEYNEDHKAIIYYFNIWKKGDESNHFKNYSFLLKEMPNGSDLKVIDMFANKYKGHGVSIPMILKSKELFNKRIISSSNKSKSHSGEANWKEAIDKVWLPMVAQGLAKYDDVNDYYCVL